MEPRFHHPYGLKVRKKVLKKIIAPSNERIMVDSGRRATQPKTAQKLMGLKNYRDLRVKHRQNLLSFNDKSKIIWGAWAPLLTPDPPKIVPTITTSVAPPPKIVTARSTTTTPWPVIKIITAKNTTPWPVIIGLPACKYFSCFSIFESETEIGSNAVPDFCKILRWVEVLVCLINLG